MNYVFSLEPSDFIELINTLDDRLSKELQEKQDELLFHRWGYELPLMEKYISFKEYKDLVYKKPKQSVSEADGIELIERIERIRKKHQEG